MGLSRPHHTPSIVCLPWNWTMTLTGRFTSLSPESPPFWAQQVVCGSCLQHLFKVGGGREGIDRRVEGLQSQPFPAAGANQRKLQTQTAHSNSVSGHPGAVCVGAKLLWHIPRGVGGKKLCMMVEMPDGSQTTLGGCHLERKTKHKAELLSSGHLRCRK